MRGTVAAAVASWLALASPASAAQIGCFSDGQFVFLHVGDTYQFYVDKGDPRVTCTPEAVKLGLELTEDAAQRLCNEKATLCEEKKKEAQLIRQTYPDLLRQSGYVEQPPAEATDQAAAKPELRLNSRDTVRFVQTSLTRLGYDPGGVDGAMGKRTAAAIRKYEKASGMPVTGKITKALVLSLQKKGQ